MQLIIITKSNTRIIIDASGWSFAVKDAALRRIPPGPVPAEFDTIELNVPLRNIEFVDTTVVKPIRYNFPLRRDATDVLYNHYKAMFLPEIQAAEMAAFSGKNTQN